MKSNQLKCGVGANGVERKGWLGMAREGLVQDHGVFGVFYYLFACLLTRKEKEGIFVVFFFFFWVFFFF
jgi:hypothetical protein